MQVSDELLPKELTIIIFFSAASLVNEINSAFFKLFRLLDILVISVFTITLYNLQSGATPVAYPEIILAVEKPWSERESKLGAVSVYTFVSVLNQPWIFNFPGKVVIADSIIATFTPLPVNPKFHKVGTFNKSKYSLLI